MLASRCQRRYIRSCVRPSTTTLATPRHTGLMHRGGLRTPARPFALQLQGRRIRPRRSPRSNARTRHVCTGAHRPSGPLRCAPFLSQSARDRTASRSSVPRSWSKPEVYMAKMPTYRPKSVFTCLRRSVSGGQRATEAGTLPFSFVTSTDTATCVGSCREPTSVQGIRIHSSVCAIWRATAKDSSACPDVHEVRWARPSWRESSSRTDGSRTACGLLRAGDFYVGAHAPAHAGRPRYVAASSTWPTRWDCPSWPPTMSTTCGPRVPHPRRAGLSGRGMECLPGPYGGPTPSCGSSRPGDAALFRGPAAHAMRRSRSPSAAISTWVSGRVPLPGGRDTAW